MQDSNSTNLPEVKKPKFFVCAYGIATNNVNPQYTAELDSIKDLVDLKQDNGYPTLNECLNEKYDGLITENIDPDDFRTFGPRKSDFLDYFVKENKPIVVMDFIGEFQKTLAKCIFESKEVIETYGKPINYKIASSGPILYHSAPLKKVIEGILTNK